MKILLSGGGTAGHITPLLAVAEELHIADPSADLLFAGQKGDKNTEILINQPLLKSTYFVHAGKFRRFHSLSLWQNITNFKVNVLNFRDFFLVVAGFFESLVLLARIRPDVIFFKGGFVVVPLGFAARLLRIPYITHDSDPVPGLANRLIAKGAKRNAVVNDAVRAYPTKKTLVSGVPLASEYESRRGVGQEKYKELLGIPRDSIVIFIYAGTQGARKIDDAMEALLPKLLLEHPNLYVHYVFGRLNEESMHSRYVGLDSQLAARLHRMTFIDNAFDMIAAADIIIGRAGATSIAEFATIGRATILVPAEQLTGGHQLENAEIYASNNAAVIVRESDLPDGLLNAVEQLIDSPKLRAEFESRIRQLAPINAAKILATEIYEIAGDRARHEAR